ncbi:MAG: hypothetical protein N2606_02965 [Candidatus Omnitrophica bacterium]|nr:hypothetical protein [Candidatus Omnitrophota bacterium]
MFLLIFCSDREVLAKKGNGPFSLDKFMEEGTKGFSKPGLTKGQSGGFKVVGSSTDTIEEKGEFKGNAYEKKTITTETKENTFSTDTVKEGSIKIEKTTTCYYDKDGRLIGKEEKLIPFSLIERSYEYDSKGNIVKEIITISRGNNVKINIEKNYVVDSETGKTTEYSTITKTSDGEKICKRVECERILEANGNVLSVNWTAQYSDGRKMTMVKEEGKEDYTIKYYNSEGKECNKEEWGKEEDESKDATIKK